MIAKCPIQKICVYAASSDVVDAAYQDAAKALGHAIGERGITLVYGAGRVGLMGEVARAVRQGGGSVIGVIPEKLHEDEIVYLEVDELHVTTGMRERKAIMEALADAFVTLPGGFGTLEEVLEVITLKQLQYHNKPVVILNVGGIYDDLLEQFDRLIADKFIKPGDRTLYQVANTVDEVFDYLDAYASAGTGRKWH